jgi:hypothetical protein
MFCGETFGRLAHTQRIIQKARRRTGGLRLRQSTCAGAYLLVAHMYMLISMPTGTSTIFGAFQAIFLFSFKAGRTSPFRISKTQRKLGHNDLDGAATRLRLVFRPPPALRSQPKSRTDPPPHGAIFHLQPLELSGFANLPRLGPLRTKISSSREIPDDSNSVGFCSWTASFGSEPRCRDDLTRRLQALPED